MDSETEQTDTPPDVAPPTDGPLKPQIVDDTPAEHADGTYVTQPAKLLRIASMTRAMLEEVRQVTLDEPGRQRLAEVYRASMDELRETLSDDLQEELDALFLPLEQEHTSESELRIVQAQLIGWLEGLFGGIQASLWSHQVAAAAAQQAQAQARHAIEAEKQERAQSGQYL